MESFVTTEEIVNEIVYFHVRNSHLGHKYQDYYVETPSKMVKPIYTRYLRIQAVFKSMDIAINNILELYYLNFNIIKDDYIIDTNLKGLLDDFVLKLLKINTPIAYDSRLSSILNSLFDFRVNYEKLCNRHLEHYYLEGIGLSSRFSSKVIYSVIDNYKEKLQEVDNILRMLIFPNIQMFDKNLLIEKFGFPDDDLNLIDEEHRKSLLEDF